MTTTPNTETVSTKQALVFAMEHDQYIDAVKVMSFMAQSHNIVLHGILSKSVAKEAADAYVAFCTEAEEQQQFLSASVHVGYLLQLGVVPQDIVEALIVHEPRLFIEGATASMRERLLCIEAVNCLLIGNNVGAIKAARQAYGNDLRESKDAVDIVKHLLFRMGMYDNDYDIRNSVTTASKLLAERIISHNERFDWITLEEI